MLEWAWLEVLPPFWERRMGPFGSSKREDSSSLFFVFSGVGLPIKEGCGWRMRKVGRWVRSASGGVRE